MGSHPAGSWPGGHMINPGDIVCLMMGAYFGIIAWAHFFNSKPSKPYYTGAELSARWRVHDRDTDTDGDTPWRDTPSVHRRERPI